MKNIIAIVLIVFVCFGASAQIPKYTMWDSSISGGAAFNGLGAVGRQTIYYPSDFPTAKNGKLTNIYFRIFRSDSLTPVIYYGLRIRIGYTTRNQFSTAWAGGDSIIRGGLVTVMDSVNYNVPNGDSNGAWIKFAMNNAEFYFDKNKNFVVEIVKGQQAPVNGFPILLGTKFSSVARCLSIGKDSPKGVPLGRPLDFGFDEQVLGLDNVSNIASVGLFPNPSNGRFVLSFETLRPVKNALITVSNVAGQEVYHGSYALNDKAFFREIALGGIPKGMYIVQVAADDERITRRLVID